MTFTNAGNQYKFKAIMQRRASKTEVMVQRLRKDGSWGAPLASRVFGNETPEQVIERLHSLNPGKQFRLAE